MNVGGFQSVTLPSRRIPAQTSTMFDEKETSQAIAMRTTRRPLSAEQAADILETPVPPPAKEYRFMKISWTSLALVIGVMSAGIAIGGCSVGMAMSGDEQKDTSILFPGSPRAVVIAKLGPPETTTKDAQGCYTDSYALVKGNAPSVGRAVAHGALDVFTLGLWEVVGTPMEMGAGREERSRLIIEYDAEDKIRNVQSIATTKQNEVTGGSL